MARALPGGDPLAEALAAGDTPTPAMVAASDDTGVLSVRGAAATLAFILLSLIGMVLWGSRVSLVNTVPMPYSPDVLEQKAREIAIRLGYTSSPADQFRTFSVDTDYQIWAQSKQTREEYRSQLRAGQPAALLFSYLQSPVPIVPYNAEGFVTPDDPPLAPSSVGTLLDTQGRLVSFRAVPQPAESPAATVNWNQLFEAAGLDIARWTPAEPRDIPRVAFDERKAWIGSYPGSPQVPLRIEAAAWRGKPVSFETFGPWRPERTAPRGIRQQPLPAVVAWGALVVVVAAVLLALVNLRNGRGDLRAAVRVGIFVAVCSFLASFFRNHHAAGMDELGKLVDNGALSLFLGGFIWAQYLAIEPYVRRHWPQVLIGWTRVLGGRLRDPIVGSGILVGIAAGFALALARAANAYFVNVTPNSGVPPIDDRSVIGLVFGGLSIPPMIALTYYLMFVLLRLALRRTWIAAVGIVGVQLIVGWRFSNPEAGYLLFQSTLMIAVSMRFGLLALAMAPFASSLGALPLTPNFSVWYAPAGWLGAGFFLALALWSFRNALGGRKMFQGDILER